MRTIILILFLFTAMAVFAQNQDSEYAYNNSADLLLQSDKKLSIGGYAQIDYNQPFGNSEYHNGTLDVHRLVILMAYNFNNRLKFITEIEYEHVKDVYIEQAFVQYKMNNLINIRAGLLLIPMGIINEYHEPPSFNGVERPYIDKYIAPTTWRELGFGISGNHISSSIKYQLYIVNGFNGYDESPNLNGKYGLRKGRQKGAASYISSPNYTAKIEYYGIRGLNIGLSGYYGNSQSSLYDGITKGDISAISKADSSIVTITMLGMDARYSFKGLQLRGQVYLSSISNTEQYNTFSGSDLGSSMLGYYIEAGYNIFRPLQNIKSQLIPFIRYGYYNTQQSVTGLTQKNLAYENTIFTAGIGWLISPKVALKSDVQFLQSADNSSIQIYNAGIGIMF